MEGLDISLKLFGNRQLESGVRDVVVGVRDGMRHTLFAITDLPEILLGIIIDISEKMFYRNNDFIYYLKPAKKIQSPFIHYYHKMTHFLIQNFFQFSNK